MRPVRIVATSVTQFPPDYVSESQLIARASVHVEALERAIEACARTGDRCDLSVKIKDWSELFMLGHLLAGETDYDWMLNPAGAAAADLAVRAVQPFRDNWLYAPTDAVVLNAVEHELARAWSLNQRREFTMHYELTMKSIADDARVVSAEKLKAALEKALPSPLIERMSATLLLDLPPEALRRIKETPRPCRERLAPIGQP